MAYRIRVTLDIDWVPDGSGMATLGQNQSNDPGYTSSALSGPVGNAQTLQLMDAELVPGGDSPTSGNFNTAFSAAATSLGTLMTTAGAYAGGTATPLSIAQGWATGNS